jgi:RES domain
VGHASAPLDFAPFPLCHWTHRFDDPDHSFRTLYVAQQKATCLREVLAPLKPDTAAIAEFKLMKLPGVRLAGEVSKKWLSEKLLACGQLEILSGDLVDLDDLSVRGELEIRHAALLSLFGLTHLNVSELRGPYREVTQTVARDLFDLGACGLIYGSNLDSQRCVALFERRFRLEPVGKATQLLNSPELREVMEELGLVMIP